MRNITFGLTFAVLALVALDASPVSGQPRFRINQAFSTGSDLTAYLEIGDSNQTNQSVGPEALSGTFGPSRVTAVSVKPFDTTGEGVFYVALIDVSRSLSLQTFAGLQSTLIALVNELKPADRMAIYTIGESVVAQQASTGSKSQLNGAIQGLQRRAGKTLLYQAVNRALDLANVQGESLPTRRVILLFSDGQDDGSGLTMDDVTRRLDDARIPIITTDYGTTTQAGVDALTKLSLVSGGAIEHVTATQVSSLPRRFQAVARAVYVARFRCDGPPDGQRHPLALSYASGTYRVSDSTLVTRLPGPEFTRPRWLWWAVAGAVGLLAVGLTAKWRLRKAPVMTAPVHGLAKGTEHSAPGPTRPLATGDALSPLSSAGNVASVRLTVVRGVNPGQTFEATVKTDAVATIGSDPSSTIELTGDPDLASRHCALKVDSRGLLVLEVASDRHTSKNGIPFRGQSRLDDGDIIGLGSTELRVRYLLR